MSNPAYLVVFTQPTDDLPESQFHEWYDNEHIPLRKDVPGINSVTRFVQLDDLEPSWAAVYELDSEDVLKSEPYTSLASKRSELEKTVLAKLQTLERRLFILNDRSHIRVREGIANDLPGPISLFVSLQVSEGNDEELHRWYEEEHISLIMKIPGWRRTRRFILKEATTKGPEGYAPIERPVNLAIHEFDTADVFSTDEWRQATNTPWRDKVFDNVVLRERRIFKTYKKF